LITIYKIYTFFPHFLRKQEENFTIINKPTMQHRNPISRHQTNHTIHSKPHLSFNSLNTKQPQDFLRNQTENKNKTNPKCTYHPNPTSTINSIKPHEFPTEKIQTQNFQTQKPRSKNK
jgi:hypothetical protein